MEQKLKYTGLGEASQNGGPNGDLYIVIRIKPHDIFIREGKIYIVKCLFLMQQLF